LAWRWCRLFQGDDRYQIWDSNRQLCANTIDKEKLDLLAFGYGHMNPDSELNQGRIQVIAHGLTDRY
jgi:tRNA A37 threonylcarbamoyladenosine dehydratase